jgi:tol-pal system protein YbgF
MQKTLIACGVAVACALAAPAAAQNRVEQQMFVEVRTLQEQNRQLLLVLNALTEQLKAVSGKVDAEVNARVKGFADQQTLINAANSSLAALQERVSENKVQTQKVTQEVDAVRKGLEMLTVMVTQALAQMPASAPPSDPNAPPGDSGAAPTQAAITNPGVPASSDEYYRRAFNDYAVGQWDLAIQGFTEYIRRFPDAPSAARAQRLIGESYFMMGKNQEAAAAFDEVIKKYKASNATDDVPDAYYKQGVVFEQLKQPDKAKANYDLVIKEYPTSNAALQAAQTLKQMSAPR